MADESITRMNLSAIKKIDPYAKEIVDSSSHVAFYTFNSEKNEWEKTDVEGAFFIYHRNAEPFHSIFINNRLNTTSFVEPITGSLELQSQPPFLLYRNERSRIRGFWFYNSEECDRISSLVNGLLLNKESNGHGQQQQGVSVLSYPKLGNSSIFNMLSQAQKEYNAQLNSHSGGTTTGGGTTAGGGTTTTGGGGTTTAGGGGTTTTGGGTLNQPDNFTNCNVLKFFESAKQATVEAQLQRAPQPLSVDELEKQHRSVTPIESSQSLESPLSPFLQASAAALPRNLLLNKLKFEPSVSESSASALIGAGAGGGGGAADDAEQCLRRLLVGESKPALMPPTMFDSLPSAKLKSETNHNQNQSLFREPLNSAQFVQAFTYCIQNDKEFVTKLHNAYINGCSNSNSLIDSNTTYQ